MLVDDVLPVYDASDAVATVVHADVGTTWDALMDADLIDVGQDGFARSPSPGTRKRSTRCPCAASRMAARGSAA